MAVKIRLTGRLQDLSLELQEQKYLTEDTETPRNVAVIEPSQVSENTSN